MSPKVNLIVRRKSCQLGIWYFDNWKFTIVVSCYIICVSQIVIGSEHKDVVGVA